MKEEEIIKEPKRKTRYIPEGVSLKVYNDVHLWLRNTFGKADRCENSDCPGKCIKFEWSLMKGKEYVEKRQNFRQLCKSCHGKYDVHEERKPVLGLKWKTCAKCGKTKSTTEFSRRRSISPTLRSACKECLKIQVALQHKKVYDSEKEHQRYLRRKAINLIKKDNGGRDEKN